MPHLLVTNGTGEKCNFPAPEKKHVFPAGESLHKDIEQKDANAIVRFFETSPSLHCSLLNDEQLERYLTKNSESETAVSNEAEQLKKEVEAPAKTNKRSQNRKPAKTK